MKSKMIIIQLYFVLLIITLYESVNGIRVKRIVGGRPAAIPPADEPAVIVDFQDHSAKVYGARDQSNKYYNFHGIRYAEPPVGRFRFQRPRKLRLEGDVNATVPGPPCPQPDPRNESRIIGSEDCLFLNVFTPELANGNEGLPVLMWIHGGGFRRGSASQYGVKHLVNKKLVIVTIQYRLGSLGFLSAGVKELPGNAGMFDMALALEWIKDYISFFGGNPQKVTVFGQGTGASSAMLLSLSKVTKGFLNGVLAMSGTALSTFAIDYNPLQTGKDLARRNGCPESPVLEMVKCLQQLPVKSLIEADNGFQQWRLAAQGVLAGLTGLLGPAPCVEGGDDARFLPSFLPQSPADALKEGNFPDIPLLTGVTRDETVTALHGKYQNEVLEKLKAIPQYFEQFMKGLLMKSPVVGKIFNRTDELLQQVTAKYFGAFKDPNAALLKLVEATGDALFNLPAFQMAKLWSKKVPKTFFYSFDHLSHDKRHGSVYFLEGLPLAASTNETKPKKGIGHGDDLPFVFYPEDYGNVNADPQDQKVMDITTDIIAQFARFGQPRHRETKGWKFWPPFTEENSNYVTITEKPTSQVNFRFCQMALWSGHISRLQSATCKALWGVTKFSEEALAVFEQGALSLVNSTLSQKPSILGSGILPSVADISKPVVPLRGNQSSVMTVPNSNTTVKPLYNAGGLVDSLLNNDNASPDSDRPDIDIRENAHHPNNTQSLTTPSTTTTRAKPVIPLLGNKPNLLGGSIIG